MWRISMIILMSVFMLGGSAVRAGIAFGMADTDGPCDLKPPASALNTRVSAPRIQHPDTGGARYTINFDDIMEPCVFMATTALRDRYREYGVTFEGIEELDGGGILDECGNFGVTGFSSPNFLAFNDTSQFADGGYARDPEIIWFDPVVIEVSLTAGSSHGGTLMMIAYNASGTPLDQQNLVLTETMQPMQVWAYGIAFVTLEHIPSAGNDFIIDDLQFESCTGLTFDDLPQATPVGTSFPGVTFSPGWIVWDSTGSPLYPPDSPPNVIYSISTDNVISWDSPQNSVSFSINTYQSGSDNWIYSIWDSGMNLLYSETYSTTLVNFFNTWSYPGIRHLTVSGTGPSWWSHQTLDSLTCCFDSTNPTPTPTPNQTPTPTPTYTPTRTPTYTPTRTPTGAPTATPTQECLNHGDVNLSGDLTAADAQMAFYIVLGLITPTYEQICAADCNGDGDVTAGDAQMIFLSVLGLLPGCDDPLP